MCVILELDTSKARFDGIEKISIRVKETVRCTVNALVKVNLILFVALFELAAAIGFFVEIEWNVSSIRGLSRLYTISEPKSFR